MSAPEDKHTLALEVLANARDMAAEGTSSTGHTPEQLEAAAEVLAGIFELRDDIRRALEGDSNDAEHDALVAVAWALGIEWTPCTCGAGNVGWMNHAHDCELYQARRREARERGE